MFATSRDGTRIAFDRLGQGSTTVVIVSGMFCDRNRTRELAERLSRDFSVINYDRRGRGESGDSETYSVEREVEDLEALVATVTGDVMVYGHSSGAGLALRAAAAGLRIARLVLHEPPYGGDDDESRRSAMELAEGVRVAVGEGRRADAIGLFFAGTGMPADAVDELRTDAGMLALANTMVYEFEVMGDPNGGTIPEALARRIVAPTMVLTGSASPDFFRDTASRLTAMLTHGDLQVLDGYGHDAPADVVAPVTAEFFRRLR